MKLSSTMFITLDGVYQAPGGPQEDPSGGFTHGGWSYPYGDEDFGRFMTGVFDHADAFLLGRRTYEIFSSYWPHHNEPGDPIANRLNDLPKHVVSTTLATAEWKPSEIVSGDVAAAVRALKERDGRELQIHGSGALVRSLLEHDLIDTLNLLSFPVLLGNGKRLFPDTALPTAFTIARSQTTSTGVVINTYERAGAPAYGSYGDD